MVATQSLFALLPSPARLVPDFAVLGTGEIAIFFLIVIAFATFVSSWAAHKGQRNRDLLAELSDLRNEYGKLETSRNQLAAHLSHEARNPLSGIVGLAHALEQTPVDANQRKILESIQSCAGVLTTVCEDTLDSARTLDGELPLHAAPFDLAACIQDCVTIMSLAASERKSKLSVTVAAGVPAKLMGDRSRLQQLIIHLLSSSLSNTEASTITVAVLDLSHGRIGFLVHNLDASESQTIATSVFKEGNGSGLVPRSKSSASSEKTLGILAAKMGGQLGKHILGNGKPAFWLTCQLPADNTPPPLSVAASTKSVLVVEDIAYNASATQAILAKLGFTADIAVDGPSALARLKAHRYDLVFMDGNLPGMSGVDVTVQYRATEGANHHAIIIATTSDSSTANREACAQAGMDAFIAKPITPEKVSLVLREHQRQTEENAGTSTPIYIEADKSADAPDLSLLQFLSDVANGGLRTQIDRYLTNLEIDRQRAHDIATSGDTKHLSQVAHRLVSHADALRYEPLRSVAVSIHAEAAIIDLTTLRDRLRRFDQAFQVLTKKLESIRASTAPS